MTDTQSVTSSVTSTASRRERLPLHVQKQLARDIESNGGIKHFSGFNSTKNLYHLLQKRVGDAENPYGNRGDPIRTKLTKKVNHWVRLEKEGKYVSAVLYPWQIENWKSRSSTTPTPAATPSRPPSPSRRAVDSESSSSSSVTARVTPKEPKTIFQHHTPPKHVVIDSDYHPPTTPLTPLVRQVAKMNVNETPNSGKRSSRWNEIAKSAGTF